MKAEARKAAFARRKAAFEASQGANGGYLAEVLAGYRGVPVSGYLAIRTEIDPLAVMAEAAAQLFSTLHALDALAQTQGKRLAIMAIPEDGLGEAINDRLRRAAAPR